MPEFGIESVKKVNRADRIRKLFSEEISQFPEICGFAMADGVLWEKYFDIPRLGHVPEEIEVWQKTVWESKTYSHKLLVE